MSVVCCLSSVVAYGSQGSTMTGTPRLAAASSMDIHDSSAQFSHAAHNSNAVLLSGRPCTNPRTPRRAHRMQYFLTDTPISEVDATRRQRGSWTLGGLHSTAHNTETGMIDAPTPHDRS